LGIAFSAPMAVEICSAAARAWSRIAVSRAT
jgi:hypothetical protein